MRVLNDAEYMMFEQICGLTQENLITLMEGFLKKKYKNVIITKDYICAEGETPIALCAHMDTVFEKPPMPEEIFYDKRKGVMWSPAGLGADDRAGVFSIIKIINEGYRPHIILTTDEERGCLGADVLAKKKCPFKDLRYIIQLDRRGKDDCVFYECENQQFTLYVEKFGFTENFGSFSDIYELCPAWEVAGVNLSVGYYNEHSKLETLYVGTMLNTIEKVKKMLSEPIDSIPHFKFILSKYSRMLKMYPGYYGYTFDDEDEYIIEDDESFQVECRGCHGKFDSEECIPVLSATGNHYFLCIDCLAEKDDKIKFCRCCGEAFEPIDIWDEICLDCRRGGIDFDNEL